MQSLSWQGQSVEKFHIFHKHYTLRSVYKININNYYLIFHCVTPVVADTTGGDHDDDYHVEIHQLNRPTTTSDRKFEVKNC